RKDYLAKEDRTKPLDMWVEKEINYDRSSEEIRNLFKDKIYTFAKPLYLLLKILRISTKNNEFILDFFAGSGTTAHAVMKLNKEDGGNRKFILVEMADYFDTVIIPRIKKVAYSFNWKEGKPQDTEGIGVFFKYHYLEQYEDTLDNIELKENKQAHELLKDEYLIKYFLDFETRESPYLLNIDLLKNPFAYKLKVNLSEVGEPQEMVIDIPETFNYLLGLKVKKIKVRHNDMPERRKYLFILGEKDSKKIVVIWREYQDSWTEKDYKEDKEFINNELKNDWKPHIVY
ncbi:MAG: DNA methyltransferase, partial [Elusimicrobiota bacterium]|nr:DNA methyltransferase [Endomicrobiia bacterium]MDW8166825.1 DNA methyltransferase [Elusimicrobiota bacterium]